MHVQVTSNFMDHYNFAFLPGQPKICPRKYIIRQLRSCCAAVVWLVTQSAGGGNALRDKPQQRLRRGLQLTQSFMFHNNIFNNIVSVNRI